MLMQQLDLLVHLYGAVELSGDVNLRCPGGAMSESWL